MLKYNNLKTNNSIPFLFLVDVLGLAAYYPGMVILGSSPIVPVTSKRVAKLTLYGRLSGVRLSESIPYFYFQ